MTVNKITLVGNVGKDAELKKTKGGSYARFTLATNTNYKNNAGEWVTETEWHNVKVWGLTAERAVSQCRKGKLVYVEGKLVSYEHEGRRLWDVKADLFRVLDKSIVCPTCNHIHSSSFVEEYAMRVGLDHLKQSDRMSGA